MGTLWMNRHCPRRDIPASCAWVFVLLPDLLKNSYCSLFLTLFLSSALSFQSERTIETENRQSFSPFPLHLSTARIFSRPFPPFFSALHTTRNWALFLPSFLSFLSFLHGRTSDTLIPIPTLLASGRSTRTATKAVTFFFFCIYLYMGPWVGLVGRF